MAFTQNTLATLPKQPQVASIQIVNADAQAQKAAFTPGASGSKIVAVLAASSDSVNRDIQTSRNSGGALASGTVTGGTFYPLGTKTVAANAGFAAGTNAVNLLDPTNMLGLPIDNDGNPYLFLGAADFLTFEALTSVTAAKAVSITIIFADF